MESTATSAYPGAVYDNRPQSLTISVGDWIVTYLISAIPFVGLIMLFVWAFSSSTPPSKANWAKAALVVALIFMAFGVLISIVFGAAIMSMMNSSRNGSLN